MPRLLVHVEGQTEEDFVNDVLRDHLAAKGYHSVQARIVGNTRRRGGIRPWPLVRKGILDHLKEDRDCIATTMVDYYGLPPTDAAAGWPGRARSATLTTAESKAQCVEEAILDDIAREMGSRFDTSRFVPFVVMHEFEALLFSDCAAFCSAVYRPELEAALREIREQFGTPEDIDDSPQTAPSKRIMNLIPGYDKRFFGVIGTHQIGITGIRVECPHFHIWLSGLEAITR